jgi:hypothetical protein
MTNSEKEDLIFEIKTAIVAILLTGAVIVGVVVACKAWEHREEDEIRNKVHSYKTITLNGVDYETDKIKEIDLITRSYEADTVTFTLSDGTEVSVSIGNWTLKD